MKWLLQTSLLCLIAALFLTGCEEDPARPKITEPFLAYLSGPDPTFDDIWCAPTGELFVCGAEGTVLRQRGKGWEKMDTGTRRWLRAIHGTAADNIYTVGTEGLVLHYDGVEWRQQYSDTRALLSDVWVAPDSSAVAVGPYGTLIRRDGGGWQAVDLVHPLPLVSAWGSGTNG
ncbi:MAG: hypothetical protein ABIF77_20720 [bacterium]